jgi:hypothetical protein
MLSNCFTAFGYVTPNDVDCLSAWIQTIPPDGGRIPGKFVKPPPPYDWAFDFHNLPVQQFLKLVVEAESSSGARGRDVSHIRCRDTLQEVQLEILIGSPDTRDSVPLSFPAFGYVSDTSAPLSAQISDFATGTFICNGNRVSPPTSPLYDWQFDFNVPDNGSLDHKVIVTVSSGGVNQQVWVHARSDL